MVHRKQGYRFENDWPPEHLEHISRNYKAGITVPVNVEIEAEHHVLNMENVKRILGNARTISVRCQFGAREMVDGALSVNLDLCFGCGLCVSTCLTNAITLVDK